MEEHQWSRRRTQRYGGGSIDLTGPDSAQNAKDLVVHAVRIKFLRSRGQKFTGVNEPSKLRLGGLQLLAAAGMGTVDYLRNVDFKATRVEPPGSNAMAKGELYQSVPQTKEEQEEQGDGQTWEDPVGCGKDSSVLFLKLTEPVRLAGYRVMSPQIPKARCCSNTEESEDGDKHAPSWWQMHVLVNHQDPEAEEQPSTKPWKDVVKFVPVRGVLDHIESTGMTWLLFHRQLCRYSVPRVPARWSQIIAPHKSSFGRELSISEVQDIYRTKGWFKPEMQRVPGAAGGVNSASRRRRQVRNHGQWEAKLEEEHKEVVWRNIADGCPLWDFAKEPWTYPKHEMSDECPELDEDCGDEERAAWVAWMLADTLHERMTYLPEDITDEQKTSCDKYICNGTDCCCVFVPCSEKLCCDTEAVEAWLNRPKCCCCGPCCRCCASSCRLLIQKEDEDIFTAAYEHWSRGYCYRWHEGSTCSTNYYDPCPDLYQEMTCRWLDVTNRGEEKEVQDERNKIFKLIICQVLVSAAVIGLTIISLTDPLSYVGPQYLFAQLVTAVVDLVCASLGFIGVVGQHEGWLRTTFIINIWLISIFTVYLSWVLFDATEVTDVCWPNLYNYRRDLGADECFVATMKYAAKIVVTFLGGLCAYCVALSTFSLLDAINDKTSAEQMRLIFRYLETVASEHVVPWSQYCELRTRVEMLEHYHVVGDDDEQCREYHLERPVEIVKQPALKGPMPGGSLPPPLPLPPQGGQRKMPAVVTGLEGHPLLLWDDFEVEWTLSEHVEAGRDGEHGLDVLVVGFDANYALGHRGPFPRKPLSWDEFNILGSPSVSKQGGEFGLYQWTVGDSLHTYVKLVSTPRGGVSDKGVGEEVLPSQWVHTVFFFHLRKRPRKACILHGKVLRAGQSRGSGPDLLGSFSAALGVHAKRRRESESTVLTCLILTRLPQCHPGIKFEDGRVAERYLLWFVDPAAGGCGLDELVSDARRRIQLLERPMGRRGLLPKPPRQMPLPSRFTVELWWRMRADSERTDSPRRGLQHPQGPRVGMDIFGAVLGGTPAKRQVVTTQNQQGRVDGFHSNEPMWPHNARQGDWVLHHTSGDKESLVYTDQCESLSVNIHALVELAEAGKLVPNPVATEELSLVFGAGTTLLGENQHGGKDEWLETSFRAVEYATLTIRGDNGVAIASMSVETLEIDDRLTNAMIAFAVRRSSSGRWFLQTLGHAVTVPRGKQDAHNIYKQAGLLDKHWSDASALEGIS
eukprot:Hpha_TRINITY_DN4283_c0_g1::TRINITY_DN4283_c0_g1_i1::g.186580::m.186580